MQLCIDMKLPINYSYASIKRFTIYALVFIAVADFALVLIQAKPFGVDEWRLIYNIKFKDPVALWSQLDFVQQFPRAYLELIKIFSAPFDYSYFTLRLPSFIVGTTIIFFCYRLMNKIYYPLQRTHYLFILILIASQAFLEHFIEVKQYTMDILLSLVAIWQLIELLSLHGSYANKGRYALLCLTFFITPFFSYTYPIAVAPVYIIIAMQSINQIIIVRSFAYTKAYLFQKWLPLIIGVVGITIFYFTDVSQVMADKGMHQYWASQMMTHGFDIKILLSNCFLLFAQVGSGVVFQAIFGIVGVSAFIVGIVQIFKYFDYSRLAFLKLYSVLLIACALGLFIAGKLPLGVSRLNAFTIASIAFLITNMVYTLLRSFQFRKIAIVLFTVLFVGLIGNILNSYAIGFVKNEYTKKLNIYVNTENAIILAQKKQIPILITPHVAFPDDKVLNFPGNYTLATNMCFPPGYNQSVHCISGDNIPGDWVLKTFPAYKPNQHLTVYAVNSLDQLDECMQQIPASIKTFLVGDGISFKIINR